MTVLHENVPDDDGAIDPTTTTMTPRRLTDDNDADNVRVRITAGIFIYFCLVIPGGTYLI
jgi:hypothetical protein